VGAVAFAISETSSRWMAPVVSGEYNAGKEPEEICSLFQQYMADGDIDSVLSVYDPEAVFLTRSGEVKSGEALRRE
jgi:hypothetical protein